MNSVIYWIVGALAVIFLAAWIPDIMTWFLVLLIVFVLLKNFPQYMQLLQKGA